MVNDSLKPAAFLDRDGVLNKEKGYLYKIEDFEWIAGAKESIKLIKEYGYFVVVVTNQSGIARGFYTEEDVIKLHAWMNEQLQLTNTSIDAFYYCPHHPQAIIEKYKIACMCRKPNTGLIEKAIMDMNIQLENSFLIGDSERDLVSARKMNIRSYLFEGGNLLSVVNKALALSGNDGA